MGHLMFQSTPILRNEFITWYQQSECRNEDQTYRSLTPFQTDTRIDAKEILTSGSDLSAQQQRPLGNSKPAISLFHIITIASDLQPAQNRPTAAHPPQASSNLQQLLLLPQVLLPRSNHLSNHVTTLGPLCLLSPHPLRNRGVPPLETVTFAGRLWRTPLMRWRRCRRKGLRWIPWLSIATPLLGWWEVTGWR